MRIYTITTVVHSGSSDYMPVVRTEGIYTSKEAAEDAFAKIITAERDIVRDERDRYEIIADKPGRYITRYKSSGEATIIQLSTLSGRVEINIG